MASIDRYRLDKGDHAYVLIDVRGGVLIYNHITLQQTGKVGRRDIGSAKEVEVTLEYTQVITALGSKIRKEIIFIN